MRLIVLIVLEVVQYVSGYRLAGLRRAIDTINEGSLWRFHCPHITPSAGNSDSISNITVTWSQNDATWLRISNGGVLYQRKPLDNMFQHQRSPGKNVLRAVQNQKRYYYYYDEVVGDFSLEISETQRRDSGRWKCSIIVEYESKTLATSPNDDIYDDSDNEDYDDDDYDMHYILGGNYVDGPIPTPSVVPNESQSSTGRNTSTNSTSDEMLSSVAANPSPKSGAKRVISSKVGSKRQPPIIRHFVTTRKLRVKTVRSSDAKTPLAPQAGQKGDSGDAYEWDDYSVSTTDNSEYKDYYEHKNVGGDVWMLSTSTQTRSTSTVDDDRDLNDEMTRRLLMNDSESIKLLNIQDNQKTSTSPKEPDVGQSQNMANHIGFRLQTVITLSLISTVYNN